VRQQRSSGFTLTELAMVVVVVALLSGMAATSVSGIASARQNIAAVRIRTALVHAQEWSMGSHNKTWVAFDTGGDLVSVFVENPANPGKANRLALSDPLTRSAMTVQLGSDGVGIDTAAFGGTSEVQFDASGNPADANGNALVSDGTVGVTGGGTIRVTRGTGLVTVD